MWVSRFSSVNDALCIKRLLHVQFARTNGASGCLRRVERSAFGCQRAAPLFQSLVVKPGHRQEQPPLSVPYSPSTCPLFFPPHLFLLQRQILPPFFLFIFLHSPASLCFLIGFYPSIILCLASLHSHCFVFYSHICHQITRHIMGL